MRSLPLAFFALAWTAAPAVAAPCSAQSSSPDAGAFELLGGGTLGARGVPRLVFDGAPLVGRSFAVRLERAASGSFGYLGLGVLDSPTPLPAFGAVVHPAPLFQLVPFATDEEGRTGALVSSAALPTYLVGIEFVAQTLAFDAAAQGGLAFSGGRRVAIGADEAGPLFRSQTTASLFRVENLACVDLDGDGRDDVLTHAPLTQRIAVHLATPGGTLGAITTEFAFLGDGRPATGDVDLDGDVDLVAFGSNALVVHAGLGDGSFAPASTSPFGAFLPGIGPLQLTDLDGDGALDALWHVDGDGWIHVALGDGLGGFDPVTSTFATQVVRQLHVGDVDGDGDADLVVRDVDSHGHLVLANDGAGAFAALGTVATPSDGYGASSLGDLDGDGVLDLVALDDAPFALHVHLGDGAGSFGNGIATALPSEPREVELVDVDGDGHLDAVVTIDTHLDAIDLGDRALVLLGRGDGTFDPSEPIGAGFGPMRFAVGDVDGDGALDLAFVDHVVDAAGALLALEAGEFSRQTFVATGPAPKHVVVGDVNADGYDDALVTSVASATLTLHLGSPTGLSSVAQTVPASFAINASDGLTHGYARNLLADATGDGRLDLVELAAAGVVVRAGLASGGFEPPVPSPSGTVPTGARPVRALVTDVNGDARADLVLALEGSPQVWVATGDATTGTTAGTTSSWNALIVLAPGVSTTPWPWLVDVDADGDLDLLVRRGPTALECALATGGGSYAPFFAAATIDASSTLSIGDANGDDLPDLALASSVSGELAIRHGLGDGTFAPGPTLDTARAVVAPFLLDLDGDGAIDVGAFDHQARALVLWLGASGASGASGDPILVATESESFETVLADVDGDGLTELLTLHGPGGLVHVIDSLLFE